ncbi:MAG: transposase, partial [Prevotellaceae bacterium]|nr:transposase [Prevotellaceae bacterium]
APFKYDSGSSVRSRCRVSQRADKSIKALLHMAALIVSTRMKGELHDYYERKVAEGKNKMLVLNAVRAKLVYRMFAVIKNDAPYEKNYAFSLA